ncbi:MAG: hypothetical protein J7J98_04720 [candidate division Zixibacteria bacterium]|nr:hypothetical protein [candidate division Zixibacteria bacterium]
MTKKIIVTYAALFLFAFTFAFAFTMASTAYAVSCCPVFDCPGYPLYQSGWGHFVKNVGCVYDGTPPCDVAYLCP